MIPRPGGFRQSLFFNSQKIPILSRKPRSQINFFRAKYHRFLEFFGEILHIILLKIFDWF